MSVQVALVSMQGIALMHLMDILVHVKQDLWARNVKQVGLSIIVFLFFPNKRLYILLLLKNITNASDV